MKKIVSFSFLVIALSSISSCILMNRVSWEAGSAAPKWVLNGNGARVDGPYGEGLYAVGIGSIPVNTSKFRSLAIEKADEHAIDVLALVIDRFWNRSLSLLSQKTGVYGLFRTFEGAPCRLSIALEEWPIAKRWQHPAGTFVYSLAFIPRHVIEQQLTQCKGCAVHPVCRLLSEHLDVVLTDYTAWSELEWTSQVDSTNWVERGSGPYADGPAGKGFYGVGRLAIAADPLLAVLELQHRAQVALQDSMALFISNAIGKEHAIGSSRIENSTSDFVPPCVRAMEHVQGQIIEMRRIKTNGMAVAALAYIPSMKVKAVLKDCPDCDQYQTCKSMYQYFDELFIKAAKSNKQKKMELKGVKP